MMLFIWQTNPTLEYLEPIIPPESVPFWPPAPGWYVIGFLIMFILVFMIRKNWIRHKRNRYRRSALIQINRLSGFRENQILPSQIGSLNVILKRTALVTFGRKEVASLTAENWVTFLTQNCAKADFTPFRTWFPDQSYQKENNISYDEWRLLLIEAEKWVKYHQG